MTWAHGGNHVGPPWKSRGPPGAIPWAPRGNHVGPQGPPQIKQAVVGYGKADKHQVIEMVTALLKLPAPPKPDDTADALAIAYCHAQCLGSRMAPYFNK